MKNAGKKAAPTFQRGDRLKASQLNAMAAAINGQPVPGLEVFSPPRVMGKLTTDLGRATAFTSNAATATMRVWRKDASGTPVAAETITVVNRFMFIDLPSNTIVKAEWIEGEWQLYAADCEAEPV